MLGTFHHRKLRKLSTLLLVAFLCVQSLTFASHGLMISTQTETQTTIAEHEAPPCHDMAKMASTQAPDQSAADSQMPCCDDGQCADVHCMMPVGTHFSLATRDYFVSHTGDAFVANTSSLDSIKPSPPIRPPIA
jgi:hypothetical protein